ncbi:2,3-bisphosphoglycerate-independent phosphoglycerate mutase [Patescibacteria group bacterium]|nr:2,3-bisphosphoglycerate-independent phosphoglycerate mutase [Patescibacteria group bacterium]
MQKAIIIICDGMADRPLRELDNKTPLEVAKTPNMDKIAVDGLSGLMHTVDVGVRPGSDTSHVALFGYDPYKYYTGRGPFECAGIGMEVRPGDVAIRGNAGTIDENNIVVDRRAGRIMSTEEIVDYLGDIEIDGVKFFLKPSLAHRVGIVLRGKGLSGNVTDQDPHLTQKKILEVKPTDDTKEAKFTADVLNKFTKVVKEKLIDAPFNIERSKNNLLPANTILYRGAGSVPKDLISFKDKFNVNAAFVAGGPMYQGIAKVFGLDVFEFEKTEGITGLPDSKINFKVGKAMELIKNHDIVFIHFKGADTLSEDCDYEGEIKYIEKIDKAISPLAKENDFLVVLTCDHTTCSELKIHTADPVPLTIKGHGVRTDDLNAFSERECAKGRMGSIKGEQLIPIVIDLMGLSKMYGA